MGRKALIFTAIVLTFMLANAWASEENEKASKPMPKFIRRLFQKLFEKDGELKEKREANQLESKPKG
jgi:hypothetical protein